MNAKLLTTGQAAKVANVHADTARRWVARGVVPHVEVNGMRMIRQEDLQAHLSGDAPKPKRKASTFTGTSRGNRNLLPARPTLSPAEIEQNRQRLDRIAARAKTAVRIEANGRRRKVKRAS